MMDFRVGRTLQLMGRTLPFILLRLAVFFGITLAYVIATGGGAGIGYLVGRVGDEPAGYAFFGGFVGFAVVSGVIYFLREYLLYLVKAGHIAVLVHAIDGKPLPEGKGQIAYATSEVRSRFVEASVLFAVDQLIKGVLKVINRLLMTIGNLLPIPALQGVMKFVTTVINLSLTYVDEVILAHNIRTQSTNPWESSREALVLYAQNYGKMLKNALFLAVIVWVLTLLIFLVTLAPFLALVSFFPEGAGFWTVVVAFVFAISLKAAIIDPFAMAALIQVYFKVTDGQQPREDWVARLEGASSKFRELGEKAAGHVPGLGASAKPGESTPPAG
ncbi:hypothetical protein TVNIR_1508 [Thioalkalivibrio nitratireducens DSM 14787]|uniref:Transmembrane protein n=1 Tax=Thioalkalivibrio nitratireducens (strain DSM 14787 / UNIQEM 213 / ALEN2) TaxID=1255043 RepID=L0DXS4_THIND|nr:hypothetical protein [Thioalkalivibrio nitratireducens]AGA33176.1 hypothetical protein TVNIR_1508 [Thioalkalivibrio nitratireducens DSM 14787]